MTIFASYDGLTCAAGRLLWLQAHDGQTALMSWSPEGGVVRVSAEGFEVGNSVHAYGGGAFAASDDGVWCVNADDGRIHQIAPARSALTVPAACGYGDLTVHGRELFGVCETEEGDELMAVNLATGETRVLASAAGFLAAPAPAAGRLAWLAWGEEQMPWESSELWLADYTAGGMPQNRIQVAGGPEESVVQPQWGPDGHLYFVSDRTGWWNLYRWDGTAVTPVAPMRAECAAAPWELGYASYAFLPGGVIVLIVRDGLRDRLELIDPDGQRRPLDLPYTSIKPYLAAIGNQVAMIAATPTTTPAVVLVDPNGDHSVLAGEKPAAGDGLDPEEPAAGEVPFLLHPPAGAGPGWSAPLIVRAHPGPTDAVTFRRDVQVDFFTGHGFAVADVDYRGSTGHGRQFRRSLYGRWGIDDVADCRTVAEHLLATGRAVMGEVFICGASAGGYTALHAASQAGPFVAAAARSPIIDPKRWSTTVPRFQHAHAVALTGGAGAVHAASVTIPVLLIHGVHDPITSATDTLDLAHDLQARQAPHQVFMIDTDSHTLSAPAHATAALEAELQFFTAQLGRTVRA